MIRAKQVIRVMTAALLGWLSFKILSMQGNFPIVILSAIFLVNLQIEDSFLKNQLYILLNGLILMAVVESAHFFSFYLFLFAGFLFTTVFWGGYLGLRTAVFYYPAVIINLFGMMVTSPLFANGVNRRENILMGLFIALVLRCILWPTTFKNEFRKLYFTSLHTIQALQKLTFEIYLKRDYPDKIYLYEKELHQKRFLILDTLNKMRILVNKMTDKNHQQAQLLNHVERLAERVVMLGNLRYRLKDYSTLEVCEKELNAMTQVIEDQIEKLLLQERIVKLNKTSLHSFEEIYQTTLQLVTNEPWIFLVFIHNIKKILSECKTISHQAGFV